MSSDLKTRKRFTSTIDKVLQLNLQELSKYTRVPQTKLLDEALEDLVKKYEQQGFVRVETLLDKEENKIYG